MYDRPRTTGSIERRAALDHTPQPFEIAATDADAQWVRSLPS
jgi:hypothetical protein